ncbi:MAG: metal ABC transporter ATP-binding protein [Lachnospirales bacterium]
MNVLEIKDLSFSYPDKSILHRLSFNLEKGDFLCVVGTNGTGKSTLLKLILNRLKPTEGSIKILGKQNDRFSDFGSIAYVSQKATAFNKDFPATVEEIVKLGLYPKKKRFSLYNKADKDMVYKALDRVGMLEYKNKQIGLLSGGQQQRVFIAKALVADPEIIFLDEPTVGIDVKAVDSICCLLGDLNKSGITIVMVTHDISSILFHSNKVLMLNEDGHGHIMPSSEFNSHTILSQVSHSH